MYTENDQVRIDSDSSDDDQAILQPAAELLDGDLPLTVPPGGIEPPADGDVVNPRARHPFYGGGIDLKAFHQLIVPQEDLGLDAGGDDLDFSQQMLAVVRRPDPQRWFALVKDYWMSTRLLAVASKTSEFATDWYCLTDPVAKAAVRQYLKDVLIVPCFLVHAKVWTIWIIPVSATKWYGSVEPLFRQPTEFYTENVFRVLADRSHGCYHVKSELISEMTPPIIMPTIQTRTVGELLGDSRFIRSINHHVVHDLTMGQPVR